MIKINSTYDKNKIAAYMEQWYFSGNWEGILVKNEGTLIYPEFVGKYPRIELGKIIPHPFNPKSEFYNSKSFLFNDCIMISSIKKDSFGNKQINNSKIKIDPKMPKRILQIISQKEKSVKGLAKKLQLPIQE